VPPRHSEPRELYLDLVEDTLLGTNRERGLIPIARTRTRLGGLIRELIERRGMVLAQPGHTVEQLETGGQPTPEAYSMIGRTRMRNLRSCVEAVIRHGVRGDLIETGVWKGGSTIYMRAILAVHGEHRDVYVADSFSGVPPPSHPSDVAEAHKLDEIERFSISLEQVRANFERFRLLDEHVRFVEGLFCDTLPHLCDREWALVRLDADLYESTMDGLVNLYPRLSPGGFLIVDDYGTFKACREAVHDFREGNDVSEPIERIDATGVYWRKAPES
jgi:O-methyltransferase